LRAVERMDATGESYRWLSVPRWYLWEGGLFLIARAQGVVPPHAHHAIQVVVALEGRPAICGHDGEWLDGRGIIVRPDVGTSCSPRWRDRRPRSCPSQ